MVLIPERCESSETQAAIRSHPMIVTLLLATLHQRDRRLQPNGQFSCLQETSGCKDNGRQTARKLAINPPQDNRRAIFLMRARSLAEAADEGPGAVYARLLAHL